MEHPRTQQVVVLVAHGSRNPLAAAEHEQLCAAVAKRGEVRVLPAYLELTEPSVPDGIAAALDAAPEAAVVVVPHFLYSGNHVERDLPELVAEAAASHPGRSISLAAHTGSNPLMVDLVLDSVAAAVRPA